jgi:hypothetical protein
MRGLVILGIVGAGAYYAFSRGMIPQAAPTVAAIKGLFDAPEVRAPQILPQAEWGRPLADRLATAAQIRQASGGAVVPVLGAGEVITVNPYEGMLRSNWVQVQPWARRNVGWAAAIARVENAQRNPALSGDNGTSHGVYQVKTATAETCYRAGYTNHRATMATLKTIPGGVYFGTAEMDRLSKINPNLDWIIQAYNGGAGWQQMGAAYIRARGEYLQRVKRAYAALYGAGVMA